MENAAAQYKKVPDSVPVRQFFPAIENYTDRIENPAYH
jgi:hypothetical protein